MQDSTVSPEALGYRSIRRLRLLLWAITLVGVQTAWTVRSIQCYDGLHREHVVRNIGWGALATTYLAIALAVTTKYFAKAGPPGESGWRKWVRAGVSLTVFAAFACLVLIFAWCVAFIRAMNSWTDGPG